MIAWVEQIDTAASETGSGVFENLPHAINIIRRDIAVIIDQGDDLATGYAQTSI